jgi:hypothetical protein
MEEWRSCRNCGRTFDEAVRLNYLQNVALSVIGLILIIVLTIWPFLRRHRSVVQTIFKLKGPTDDSDIDSTEDKQAVLPKMPQNG